MSSIGIAISGVTTGAFALDTYSDGASLGGSGSRLGTISFDAGREARTSTETRSASSAVLPVVLV